MYSWNGADDRVAIVQMNAELRHARLDLLSAQCATDRLRLRFSVEDLAQYGERDILRKAIGTALALSDYYLSIQKQLPTDSLPLTEPQLTGRSQDRERLSLERTRDLPSKKYRPDGPPEG